MSITSIQFVILGVAAFVLAGLLTWPVRALAIKLSVMDLPNMERKTQKEPVPYLGGVAIALSIIIVTYGAIYYSDNTKTTFPLITYALLPAAVLGLMGLIDDIKGLPALPRLIAQTVVAILVAIFMLHRNLDAMPFSTHLYNDIISVVWIVAICNSINFFDNLDARDVKILEQIIKPEDVVFNLIAFNGTGNFYEVPSDVISHSALTGINIALVCATKKVKSYYYFGSSESYAGGIENSWVPLPTPEKVPFVISDPSNVRWSYAISKQIGEMACHANGFQHGLNFLIFEYLR